MLWRAGKRVGRSSASVEEAGAKVQAAVCSRPGRRLGEIAAQLGMDAKEIRRPAQVLVAERKLRTTAGGAGRGTCRVAGGRTCGGWPSLCPWGSPGDTGLTTEYRSIRERLGPFHLVLLEVGAFHPAWGDIHPGPVVDGFV